MCALAPHHVHWQRVGLKTVTNGRENLLTVSVLVFFFAGNKNGNGKDGRENEIGITGYREQNISIGNMSITCNHSKHLAQRTSYNHTSIICKQYTGATFMREFDK